MLSHYCDAIDILCIAGTAPMALDSEYVPSLAVKKPSVWRELPSLTVPV
jgi:hypothetical protein